MATTAPNPSGHPAAGPAEPLPVQRIATLDRLDTQQRWLIQSLWGRAGVGILAGDPKCCKTWLGLEMAISVASGTPALGRFPVEDPGPVLVYLAEDALPQVRERAEGICRARSVDLDALPLFVITVPVLRLDQSTDQDRLVATLQKVQPRMLLLDPLVRLHQLNENRASDISWLLGHLRYLQRAFDTAVVLVHHANKKYRDPGRALRGSSDLYAFGDTLAFLSRRQDRLILSVEHRFAPAPGPWSLSLQSGSDPSASHLVLQDQKPLTNHDPDPLHQRLLELLQQTSHPLQRQQLRQQLRVNNQRLGEVLLDLQNQGALLRSSQGWSIGTPLPRPEVSSRFLQA